MGYRSEIAIVIRPERDSPKEWLDMFVAEEPRHAETIKNLLIDGYLVIDEDEGTLSFHQDGWKWYCARLTLGVVGAPYKDVEALDRLFFWTQEKQDEADRLDVENGRDTGGLVTAAFIRIGDDNDDAEEYFLGHGWELAEMARTINVHI